MNKTLLLLGLTLLLPTDYGLQAQSGKNEEKKQEKNLTLFELISLGQRGYISVFTDGEETPSAVQLAFIGPNEVVEASKEIPLRRRGVSAMLEGAFLWDGQLVLVTSLFYPGPQRDHLFIRRFSIPDLEEVDAEEVAEAFVPGRLRIPFGYALSPDSSKIMFYSWTYAVPEDPVKMEIHVFNRSLKRLWSKRFLLPNKNKNFFIYACRLDNAGNAYLLCEDYKGKVGRNMKVQDEKIERFVLRLAENSNDATSFVIQLQGLAITSLRFISDDRGNLIGAGFYKEPNKHNQAGFFAYRIDQQTQGFRKWEFPVNKDQYQMMHAYTDQSGKYVSGTRQMRDYVLDHLVWDDEQGLTLVAEQRIFIQDEDNYNDIMVIQLDTSFRKKISLRIPKKQSAFWSAPDFASYQFLQRGQRQFVLFNDLVDNIPTEAGLPNRIKEMDLVFQPQTSKFGIHLVEIEDNGRIKHQDLKPVIQAGATMGLVPGMTRSDGDNVFLLYLSYLNNPEAIGKVFPISWMTK